MDTTSTKYAGSKRKARALRYERKLSRGLSRRLERIYQLSQLLHNESELAAMLATIPDEAVRAETRKLIESFVPWKIQHVELATSADLPADLTGSVVIH